MLNPAFSKTISEQVKNDYILPKEVVNIVKQRNISFDTGPELKIQKIYGDELRLKLKSLGLDKIDWQNKDVLDVCSGTGFLSYHLLSRVKPKSLTLLDISKLEIREARNLLSGYSEAIDLKFIVSDAAKTNFPDNSFDIIIGNSFLHHFYDLPAAIKEFKRILKPDGLFVSLHEPTIASLAMESRNPLILFRYFLYGDSYIDKFYRYKGEGVAPNQGQDVWMFKEKELVELLNRIGFDNIKVIHWHFLRAKITAVFSLHLNEKKEKLSSVEISLLRTAIFFDSILSKILPSRVFSSVAVAAQKTIK